MIDKKEKIDMERFFIIQEGTELHTDYFNWRSNSKKINDLVKEFTKKHGIQAYEYSASNNGFYIAPHEEDMKNLGKYLNKPVDNGICKFKANSKIHKEWIALLESEEIKVLRKPHVLLYLRRSYGGRYRSRLFDDKNVLYMSIDPYEGEAPDGFTELKASEFFKIIEDIKEAS